jgi:hypothetical protein
MRKDTALSGLVDYGVATAASGLAAVAAIPLLLTALGLGRFGQWGILEPLMLLASQAALLGANFAIFEIARRGQADACAVAKGWAIKLLIVLLAMVPLAWPLARLLDVALSTSLLILLVITVDSAVLLMQAAVRAEGQSRTFLYAAILKSAPWVIGLGLIVWLQMGSLEIVLVVRLLASASAALFLWAVTSGPARAHPLGPSLKYGIPITASAVLLPLGDTIERMMLASFVSLEATGTYVIAAKYAGILALGLFTPMGLWWSGERVRIRKLEDGGMFLLSRVQAVTCLVGFLAASGCVVASPVALKFLAGGQQHPSTMVIALLVYAAMARGVMPVLGAGAMEPGWTWISMASGVGAMLTLLISCLSLGPWLGSTGIATSNALASAVGLVMFVLLANRALRLPHSARLLFGLCVSTSIGVLAVMAVAS